MSTATLAIKNNQLSLPTRVNNSSTSLQSKSNNILKKASLATLDYAGKKVQLYNKIMNTIGRDASKSVSFVEGFFLPSYIHSVAKNINNFLGNMGASFGKAFPQVMTFGAPSLIDSLRTEVAIRGTLNKYKEKSSNELLTSEAKKLGLDLNGGAEELRKKPEVIELISQNLAKEITENVMNYYKDNALGKLSFQVNEDKEVSQIELDKMRNGFENKIKERLYAILNQELEEKDFKKKFNKIISNYEHQFGSTQKALSAVMYAVGGVITKFKLWDNIGRVVEDVLDSAWDRILKPFLEPVYNKYFKSFVNPMLKVCRICKKISHCILHPIKGINKLVEKTKEKINELIGKLAEKITLKIGQGIKDAAKNIIETQKDINQKKDAFNEALIKEGISPHKVIINDSRSYMAPKW